MFSLYSKGCEYAIRALAEISAEKAKDKFLARDICREAGIPEAYARKTFQALVQKGFLTAVSGPRGGYSLTRDPSKTTVLDVIVAVEGDETFSKCILGLPVCKNESSCALHSEWMKLKKRMRKTLRNLTLIQLSAASKKRKRL